MSNAAESTNEIERIYKTESGRVLATLVRILGDLDLAEESLQEAFYSALKKWPEEGLPANPYAWLVSAGKFKAIDTIRRSARGQEIVARELKFEKKESGETYGMDWPETHLIDDDQLRLIFYCCHPLLPLDSRIALSLREVCGMSIEEIAHAYLASYESIKKRISRAKALIKEKNIPYEIPSKADLSERLVAVLHVIYLIYNEGYAASSGEHHIRQELTSEAIFLARKLVELIPSPEGFGLLALCLLQESRKNARLNQEGDIIPLEQQDRSLWNQGQINEGLTLIHQAVMSGRLGPYSLQAAIASVHAVADSLENTQWDLIIGYYDMLLCISPSPVIELNRAIAVGMHKGPEAALTIIESLQNDERLNTHPTVHAARAKFCKQLNLKEEAIKSYEKAIAFSRQEPEKRHLKQQLNDILK